MADASVESQISAAQEATMNLQDQSQSFSAGLEADRRRYPRRTVNVQIEIRPDGSDIPLRLETTDLSRGGCYVQIMLPLSLGKRLGATLWLDGEPIVVRGLVVTRHPSFGNGIMFLDFEAQGEQVLNRYMDKLIGI
jgi:PilZ domain